jgi:hypothetical protein
LLQAAALATGILPCGLSESKPIQPIVLIALTKIFVITPTLLDIFVSRNAATLATQGLSEAIGINRCDFAALRGKCPVVCITPSFRED